MPRIVLHVDMDSFFASVEERDHPRITGMPIVVGSDPANGKGRGVVSTANYAARAYGIKSAIPISRAWQLSQKAKAAGKPEAVFFEPNIKKYAAISREIFEYIASQGAVFESGGIDECYVELQGVGWAAAMKTAKRMQEYIQKKFQLSCSIGIGPNKLIAKIAAGRQKPHGLTMVRDTEVQDFLDPLPARELRGIGVKTAAVLNDQGIETVKQLRQRGKAELMDLVGKKHGESMYYYARGVDTAPLEADREAKSIGSEVTLDVDTLDAPTIVELLKRLAGEVARSVKKEHKVFKVVGIVVRFSDFETKTRSHTIETASDSGRVLEAEALKLLLPFLDSRENPKKKKFRLIGVRAEKLQPQVVHLF